MMPYLRAWQSIPSGDGESEPAGKRATGGFRVSGHGNAGPLAAVPRGSKIVLGCAFGVLLVGLPAAAAELVLIDNGALQSEIVLGQQPTRVDRAAARELQWHLKQAAGCEVPIVAAADAGQSKPSARVQIFVGDTSAARAAGIDATSLRPEEFRIKTSGKGLFLVGHLPVAEEGAIRKPPPSQAVRYATSYFLDRQLGARWLWPGKLGTYVPRQATISIPALDVTARPELEKRNLRIHLGAAHGTAGVPRMVSDEVAERMVDEAEDWSLRHMLGSRTEFDFGHSFGKWWDRFSQTHVEYFAHPPEGAKQPYPFAERVKLCVSHPGVAEQIMADWTDAGKPDNWNVCPNDSRGFCTCERCRALDGVPGQSPEVIWNSSEAVLTGRYVTLWNELMCRMKPLNPKATLSSYAYSAYRQPLPGMKLEDGIVLGMVDQHYARDEWQAWRNAGARLFLRPNWWHTGASAPYLPLHRQGEFFRFAQQEGMIGFDFDSLLGQWGTQGPLYYLIARLSARPDLSVDDVLTEYVGAFGSAAPAIRRYLQYWEAYSERCNPQQWPEVAGEEGLFSQVASKLGLPNKSSRNGHMVLPHLYGGDVIAKAEAILDQARALAAADEEALERVQFLRDGLRHLRLHRDTIALAYEGSRAKKPVPAELPRQVEALMKLRAELSSRHVVWGEALNLEEQKRGVRFAESVGVGKTEANAE